MSAWWDLLQAPLSVADVAAWRTRTQPAVAAILAQLHSQLVDCLRSLEQRLEAKLAAAKAAAMSAEQVGRAVACTCSCLQQVLRNSTSRMLGQLMHAASLSTG